MAEHEWNAVVDLFSKLFLLLHLSCKLPARTVACLWFWTEQNCWCLVQWQFIHQERIWGATSLYSLVTLVWSLELRSRSQFCSYGSAFRASCQALSHAVTQPDVLMGLPGRGEALVLRLQSIGQRLGSGLFAAALWVQQETSRPASPASLWQSKLKGRHKSKGSQTSSNHGFCVQALGLKRAGESQLSFLNSANEWHQSKSGFGHALTAKLQTIKWKGHTKRSALGVSKSKNMVEHLYRMPTSKKLPTTVVSVSSPKKENCLARWLCWIKHPERCSSLEQSTNYKSACRKTARRLPVSQRHRNWYAKKVTEVKSHTSYILTCI